MARQTRAREWEAFILGNLARLALGLGDVDEANARLEAALALARDIGSRRVEGMVLGTSGLLLIDRGRHDEALQAVREGERMLREACDPDDLAQLLCDRARVEVAAGRPGSARAALLEAEALAARLGAGPESPTGRDLARARAAVEGLTPPER